MTAALSQIPISAVPGRVFASSSGISVIVASVSSRTLAAETAFSSATRCRIDDAGLDQIDIFVLRGIIAHITFALQHSRDYDTTIDRGVFGNLSRGRA